MTSGGARWAVAAALAAALLTGCSDDGDSPAASGSTTSARACVSAPATQQPRASTTADLGEQPQVEGSDEAPPCDLVTRDVVGGQGAEVVPGSAVEVRYVGAFYETGEVFDASWRGGPERTLPFVAGAGNLIEGFDRGVLGMREGGRREIVVPSQLGYGPHGSGPVPGGATLVFVVDVVSVQAA